MRCERSRELLSAQLDSELPDDEQAPLDRHLATCAECRVWSGRAQLVHRSLRLQAAPAVPDLAAGILAAVRQESASADAVRAARSVWSARPERFVAGLRIVLVLTAVTQMALSLPEVFFHGAHAGTHQAHHLSGWDVAFAIGLLVAGLQPWRARGLFPMAAAVGAVMGVTTGMDLLAGATPGMADAPHALELVGLALVWRLSRIPFATPSSSDDGGGWRVRTTETARRWGTTLGLRPSSGSVAQMSAVPSPGIASASASADITASRARATRDRTVPTGHPHTDAVSA